MSQQAQNLIAQARTEGWKRLELGNCGLTDLEAQVPELFELQQLEELVLSNTWWDMDKEEEVNSANTGTTNKLSQLPQAMAQLTQLKVLVCEGDWNDGWSISDIGVLQSLTQLTTLSLVGNEISDIGVLQSLTQLTTLSLVGNEISDIGVLQSLTQLSTLNLIGNQISDIGVLQYLTQLTTLHLSNNQISDIDVLQSLTQLTTLDLMGNQISDIGVLKSLTQLTTLDLSLNQISNIGVLQSLTQLTNLELIGNQISDIGVLQYLTQLTYLNLYQNQISDIGVLQSLTQLTTLYLWNNQISDIGVLQSLTQLTTLDLRYNQISDIGVLQSLTQLTTLYLMGNQISDIGVLQSLTQLTTLDLQGNKISDIGVFKSPTQLTTLYLSSNQISDIGVLQSLTQLTTLYLSDNQISDIGVLQSLTQLTTLYLSDNQISDIGVLQSLTQLTTLYLSDNQISDIGVLQSLTQLTHLNLQNNQISDIGVLQSLTQLTHLNLQNNQISDLSPLLTHYKKGVWINVDDNPLTNPPAKVIKQGDTAIVKWLEKRAKGEQVIYLYEAKMLLVGQGNVGKSSLLFRLNNPTEQLPVIERTRGVHIEDYTFKYQGKTFRAHVWDFGGQDVYYELHRFFLTDNALYLLMTDTRTDQGAKLEEWLHTIELFSGNKSPIIMVQNVFDAAPLLSFNLDTFVTHHQIYENRLLPVDLKETSSPQTQRLLEAIEHKLHTLPHIAEPILNKWLLVRKGLQTIAKKQAIIDYSTYQTLCNKHGIPDADEQTILCRYLHNLGILLWYNQPHNRFLRRKIILNPQWLLDPIYQLIDNKGIKNHNGKCSFDDLETLWCEAAQKPYQNELIELMKEFRLCYQYKHAANTFIIPSLMNNLAPAAAQAFDADSNDAWQLVYRYKRLMPRGIVNQLTAELHRQITNDFEHVWVFGVLLHSNNATAKITSDSTSKEISIKVIGDKRDRLLNKIRQALDNIHETYNNLPVEITLPCTCVGCANSKVPTLYDYEHHILREIERGNKDIHCLETRKYVEIKAILQNVGFSMPYKLQKMLPNVNELRIFIAYASEDLGYAEAIKKQLSPLIRNQSISSIWYDRQLLASDNWNDTIQDELDNANVVLLLISPDFLDIDKNYIWEQEMPKIKSRHQNRNLVAIPIIVRDCLWEEEEYISSLQVIAAIDPGTNKRIPLKSATDKDTAFAAAARQIKEAISKVQSL